MTNKEQRRLATRLNHVMRLNKELGDDNARLQALHPDDRNGTELIIESRSATGKLAVFSHHLEQELNATYLFDVLAEFYEKHGNNIILRIYKE